MRPDHRCLSLRVSKTFKKIVASSLLFTIQLFMGFFNMKRYFIVIILCSGNTWTHPPFFFFFFFFYSLYFFFSIFFFKQFYL